ncbi:hypothetical protein BDR07DRAFT_1609253 [Suillus spraguei]|nr:hypothetical protein BDR07DRAFT_1609253 [Suillus spraguei]
MILGDFSACIFIDDEELPEYDVVVSSTPTENRITCWIASVEGKKFGVRSKFLAPQTSGSVTTVIVDGIGCHSYITRPNCVGTFDYTSLTNAYVKRDFMFSKIELTDDDSLLDDRTSNDIGQIVLEVAHGKYTLREQVVDSRNVIDRTLRVREGKVHERSKKACSHRIAFGEEVPHHEPASAFTVIRDNSPKTIFVFKYTHLDVLQAMGVAPHTPIKAETEIEAEDHNYGGY